jgi:hypothetical protein
MNMRKYFSLNSMIVKKNVEYTFFKPPLLGEVWRGLQIISL